MRRVVPVVVTLVATAPGVAHAGVGEWRLNEVLRAGAGPGSGDGTIRFIELYTVDGGCWFPSTQVALYDGAGAILDAEAPFVETTCFGADSYLLLATPASEAAFAVDADRPLVMSVPSAARQLCLRSTGTIYDCVRWGAVTTPVHDLFAPDDDSAALAPPAGLALARIADTDVIADDWIVADPTPRGPNDGTPWIPPDAGPGPDAGPDAGPGPDASPGPDAGPAPDANVDAAPRPDGRDDRFLDLDAGGGATCGCRGTGAGGGSTALLLLLAALWLRRAPAPAA